MELLSRFFKFQAIQFFFFLTKILPKILEIISVQYIILRIR